ncbi:MAG: SDR family NAD(P)-dependent oxidoreductase, partial [bacterium]|nr:SDR family NAD(P)-dependent oxidoreductase [bacterium]
VVHSQGTALLNTADEVPALDIESLKAECDQERLSSDECYEAFAKVGLEYGAGHRGIEDIYLGEGRALAKLALPSSASDTADQFILHPALMDSALQASIGLTVGFGKAEPALPFALERLEIFSRCTSSMWAFVRYSEGSLAGDKVRKLDIDLCDEGGKVCARMKGFTSRVQVSEADATGTLMLKPSWREEEAPDTIIDAEGNPPDYEKHLIVLCEPDEALRKNIDSIKGAEFIILESKEKNIDKRFSAYALRLFEEIQSILKTKPKEKVLLQLIISAKEDRRLFAGFSGLLKTAHSENPKFIGQLIETDREDQVHAILEENSRRPADTHIKHKAGKRLVAEFEELEALPENPAIVWKDKGIYLISGGAGGLGLIFAKEITEQVKDPVLILTGRSELSADKKAHLEGLKGAGARVEYRQADVTQNADVENLIKSIEKEFGTLNGIIHAAGIIRDNYNIKKTKEEF